LAPLLEEPHIERDPEKNQITLTLTGSVGPKVEVNIENYNLSEKRARTILPVLREGTVDFSAIVEGERRLENRLQEDGFFFSEVLASSPVTPPLPDFPQNGSRAVCENLNPEVLAGHSVTINYQVDLGRRFRLTDIRITGTNKLTFDDIAGELKSQKANALNLIPFLGFGRGYTSTALLEQDKRTIVAHMRDFGYRRADVEVLQGVSIRGDNLIITFKVTEGPLTRVAGLALRGNKVFPDTRLRQELQTIVGAPYSRSVARADTDRLIDLYALHGFIDAEVVTAIVDLPKKGEDEQVRMIFDIRNEGDKVFINRIIVNGVSGDAKTQRTKRDAIVRATPLVEGQLLRADRVNKAERALYATDAFEQVIIHS